MTIIVTMRSNISSLKAKLSENLEKVKNGETIVVYDRNTPVAQIIPFHKSKGKLVAQQPVAKLIDMKLNIKIDIDPANVILEGRSYMTVRCS